MKMDRKKILIIVVIVVVILAVLLLMMAWNRSSANSKGSDSSLSPSDSSSSRSSNSWVKHKATTATEAIEGIQVANANGETQVTWNPLANADHYTMYYSPQKGFDVKSANKHDPIEDNSMSLASDVPMGYYFRVTATRNVDGTMVETPLSEEHFMQLNSSQ